MCLSAYSGVRGQGFGKVQGGLPRWGVGPTPGAPQEERDRRVEEGQQPVDRGQDILENKPCVCVSVTCVCL